MMNYACGFSQSEKEKYVDWITIFFTPLWKKNNWHRKMENHFALQHQLQEFLYEDQLGAAAHTPNLKKSIARNDNCVPRRLRDQPKKNENNLKEYWTQLTLRMRETTRARFPIGFLIFSYPYFSRNPCFSLDKLTLQFFNKETYQEKFKKRKPCSCPM